MRTRQRGDGINQEQFKKELEERLLNFAVAMVNMSTELPRNAVGFEIGKQIVKSGCSPYANVAVAKFAVSKADFIHKMRICRVERIFCLDESNCQIQVAVLEAS